MNRSLRAIALLLCAACVLESCSVYRKARQARRTDAARRADTSTATNRQGVPARVQQVGSDDTSYAGVDGIDDTAGTDADTVETSLFDTANLAAASPALLLAHGKRQPLSSLTGKLRVAYEAGKEDQEFSATIRLRRDSAIWISATAAGGLVPVARALLTPDTVLFVNYLQREAFHGGVGALSAVLPIPVSFNEVQAFLLGEAMSPALPITGAGVAEGSGDLYLETGDKGGVTGLRSYYRAADTVLTGEDFFYIGGAWAGQIRYDDYELTQAIVFPLRRTLEMQTPNGTQRVTARFTDKPRVNVPLDFSFSIPSNYTLK